MKILSYLAYGAPLLVFILPFVGQDWNLVVWRYTYKLGFIPLFVLLLIRLKIDSNTKTSFPILVAVFGSMFVSGMTGRFAYSNRSHPLNAFLHSLTLIIIYAILIGFAPRLRKAYDQRKGSKIKKAPFDLTAETFRLPPQSVEPTEYPRM